MATGEAEVDLITDLVNHIRKYRIIPIKCELFTILKRLFLNG